MESNNKYYIKLVNLKYSIKMLDSSCWLISPDILYWLPIAGRAEVSQPAAASHIQPDSVSKTEGRTWDNVGWAWKNITILELLINFSHWFGEESKISTLPKVAENQDPDGCHQPKYSNETTARLQGRSESVSNSRLQKHAKAWADYQLSNSPELTQPLTDVNRLWNVPACQAFFPMEDF